MLDKTLPANKKQRKEDSKSLFFSSMPANTTSKIEEIKFSNFCIQLNSETQSINLSCKTLNRSDLELIIHLLQTRPIKHLDISEAPKRLSDRSIIKTKLLPLLANHKTLESLNLATSLSDKEIKFVVDMFATNQTLQKLGLARCFVSDGLLETFISKLKQNPDSKLKQLDLTGNWRITEKGLLCLADYLAEKPVLSEIYLVGTSDSSKVPVLSRFLEVIKENTAVTILQLWIENDDIPEAKTSEAGQSNGAAHITKVSRKPHRVLLDAIQRQLAENRKQVNDMNVEEAPKIQL